ncbi:MAG: 50S ribosomal protein L29 [Patescibacteria group bacterium]
MNQTTGDLRKQTDEELNTQLLKSELGLFNQKVAGQSGKVKDTNVVRKLRRNLARIKTVMTERKFLAEISLSKENAKKYL